MQRWLISIPTMMKWHHTHSESEYSLAPKVPIPALEYFDPRKLSVLVLNIYSQISVNGGNC